MFKRPQKKTIDRAHLRGLTEITPAKQLFTKYKRPEKLAQIATTCQLGPERFKTLCGSLVETLLNYTQQLPDTTNSYFSSPGGAFDHALSRTVAAHDLFQSFILNSPNEKRSEIQLQWWYALFSASLLRGIGKLPLDYEVSLYNEQEHLIKTWAPLDGPLYHQDYTYYQFETVSSMKDDDFRQRLNIVLAQKLMPKEGLMWLQENLDIFEVWLALLQEDSLAARSFGLILDRADDIAIQEDLIDFLVDIEYPKQTQARAHTFIDTPRENIHDREKIMGAEFIKFLQEKLKSGEFIFNRAPLVSVLGGTMILKEAFELFMRQSPFKSSIAIMKSIESLGLSEKTQNLPQKQSLTLKGSLGLPNTFEQQTNKDTSPSTTNVIDARNQGTRETLSKDGKWEPVPPPEAPPPMQRFGWRK